MTVNFIGTKLMLQEDKVSLISQFLFPVSFACSCD